jgi:Domain of unknown function (DUF4276)
MAASRRSVKLGVLAEEDSDVDVLKLLLPKISPAKRFGTDKFVGHGCGKLRNKCRNWAAVLAGKGCSVLIVLHDSDGKNPTVVRNRIEAALKHCPIEPYVIVIPVEELEAWLLTDANALRTVFSLKKIPKCPSNPERIRDPKEYLEDLVWKTSGKSKRYVNTIYNSRIAQRVSLASLRRCPSFLTLQQFWL